MPCALPPRLIHTESFIRKRIVEAGGGFVYIIECCGFVKVGVAQNTAIRMAEMQVGNPFPICLLGSFAVADPYDEESKIHKLLRPYHVRGEWFNVPPAIINHVLRGHSWKRIAHASRDPEYFI